MDSSELDLLGQVAGKDICVLGSGDNLGARVTSVDISQAQLDTAASRAGKRGLDIAFVRADVANSRALPSLPTSLRHQQPLEFL